MRSLLNDSFTDAYNLLIQTINEFGYALSDIVNEISIIITRKELPDKALSYILDKLSNIEHRLSKGASEKLQVGALVGIFVIVRDMISLSSK